MKNFQKEVSDFCKDQKLECSVEYRLLDLLSELGEVSKEILNKTQFGKKPFVSNFEFLEEMGDLSFCLIALANETGVDLESVTRKALEKYKMRIEQKGHPGSH